MFEVFLKIISFVIIMAVIKFLLKSRIHTNNLQEKDKNNESYSVKKQDIRKITGILSLWCLILVIVIAVLYFIYPPGQSILQKATPLVSIIIFAIISASSFLYGLYTYNWEISVTGERIEYTLLFGKKKIYSFGDISHCIENHRDKIKVYSSKKKLFVLSYDMDIGEFIQQLNQRNIPIKNRNKMTEDNFQVSTIIYYKVFIGLSAVFFCGLDIFLIIKHDSSILLFIFAILLIFYFVKLKYERTVFNKNEIYQYRLFRKKKIINLNKVKQARMCEKMGVEYVVLYDDKKNELIKIKKECEGKELLLKKVRL